MRRLKTLSDVELIQIDEKFFREYDKQKMSKTFDQHLSYFLHHGAQLTDVWYVSRNGRIWIKRLKNSIKPKDRYCCYRKLWYEWEPA